MEFIVCGGEKWCRNAIFLSFGILHNFSILTITNSTFDSQHSAALWFHWKLIGTSSSLYRYFLMISLIHHLYKIMYLSAKTFAHLQKKQYLCTLFGRNKVYE
jgi:hypothetical protein